MEKEKIQIYLNNFRRFFTPYVRKDINFRTVVYPADDGAIIEIFFKKFAPVKDEFKKQEKSIVNALMRIDQHSFGGNLNGFHFTGTNIVLEQGKILIIKENKDSEWSIEKAKDDINKLVNPQNNK